jgi:hypothetical protein
MATKKQRKRAQKDRRHEYETVWVDAEGNDLEEPPDDLSAPARETRQNGSKRQQKRAQQSSSRPTKTALPPSWRRAAKRSFLLGVVIFVLFSLLNRGGSNGLVSALLLAGLYTVLFIPFTYYVDRFVYQRAQRRQAEQSNKR